MTSIKDDKVGLKQKLEELQNSFDKLNMEYLELKSQNKFNQDILSRNEVLHSIINSSRDVMIVSVDRNYCYTAFNDAHKKEMKIVWKADVSIGDNLLNYITDTEHRERVKHSLDRALNGEHFTEVSYRLQNNTYYELNWNPVVRDSEVIGANSYVRNVTQYYTTLQQLSYLKKLYATLSQINQAVVRIKDIHELYTTIVNVFVTFGEMNLAWIGLLDEKTSVVKPVAGSGPQWNEQDFSNINVHKAEFKNDPVTRALLNGETFIINDIRADDNLLYRMPPALKNTVRSLACLPVSRGGTPIGVLNLYSSEPGFFNNEEVSRLLDEIAMDISFALENMENERIKKQWADAFQHCAHGIAIGSPASGNILACNQAFANLQERSIEEIISMPILNMYMPDDHKNVMESIKAADTNGSSSFEARMQKKDGNSYFVQMDVVSVKDEDGSIMYRVATQQDITIRKQAEEEVQKSEIKFRNVFENSSSGIALVNSDFRYINANPSFCRMLGYSESELLTKSFKDITHPEDLGNDLPAIIKLINKEIPVYLTEKRYIRKDGEIIWVSLTVTANYDAEGKFLFNISIMNDITERKRIEKEIQIQSERLEAMHQIDHAILQSMQSPLSVVRSTLAHLEKILQCKGAFVGLFNPDNQVLEMFTASQGDDSPDDPRYVLSKEEFGNMETLGRGKISITEDVRNIDIPIAVKKILEKENIRSFIQLPLYSSQAFYGTLNIGWEHPRTIEAGEVDVAEEVASQISLALQQSYLLSQSMQHNLELEERVTVRTKQLEESNKDLEAFSYSVSHDLRAPLRHISGYVDLLTDKFESLLPEKGKHYLEVIQSSSKQMSNLIDDLLRFSRTGRQEMRIVEFDMQLLITEVLELIKLEIQDRNVEWNVEILPEIKADPALIRLVWFNLLSNAVKFSRGMNPAVIKVSSHEDANEIIFSVEDNGAGFDMRYAHKLFGVFQRLHSTQEFEGSGIGLANVRRIILKHGGRTWAESEPGQGAKFYFSIPKNKEEIQ